MVWRQADDITQPVQRRGENIPEKKKITLLKTPVTRAPNATLLFFFFFKSVHAGSATLTPTKQIFYVRNPRNSAEPPSLSSPQQLWAPQRPSAMAPKAGIGQDRQPQAQECDSEQRDWPQFNLGLDSTRGAAALLKAEQLEETTRSNTPSS